MMNVQQFFKRFPDDDACLDHLMQVRYGKVIDCPKCKKVGEFHRIKKIPAYSCSWCGHHIHPMAGTPFERSTTSLQKWFYAMYLFTTSRHGVPAMELQRQLGVTYKTAWRIGHEIRKYMAYLDGDDMLGGVVEADETYIGGKKAGMPGRSLKSKAVVFGMLERDGDVMLHVVQSTTRRSLGRYIRRYIVDGTVLSTDENRAYQNIPFIRYQHITVNHSAGEYVKGQAHTNSLEGMWSMLKRSVRGTHIHVSRKWLHSYLGEFEFRYNLRKSPEKMFPLMLFGFQ